MDILTEKNWCDLLDALGFKTEQGRPGIPLIYARLGLKHQTSGITTEDNFRYADRWWFEIAEALVGQRDADFDVVIKEARRRRIEQT